MTGPITQEIAKEEVERLLAYGLDRGLVVPVDLVEIRNALLEVMGLAEPAAVLAPDPQIEVPPTPEAAVAKLVDYAVQEGFIEDTTTHRDLFDTKLMGLLTPRSSQVIEQFQRDKTTYGVAEALDRFYQFSQDTLYIRQGRIAKNVIWTSQTEYGELEITINLSKPEKDPREIAAARNAPQSGYPACALCRENVGYPGRINHPARQNHRILPLTLNGKQWYFQYSPYVYYHQHCIVLHAEHVPMEINRETFANLIAFVRQVPHYFIGSNADLPIVGGSILSHDHYQGGFHRFPMERAAVRTVLRHREWPEVEAAILHWPLSTLRLRCADGEALIPLATQVLEAWRGYSDPEVEILATSQGEDQQVVRHNTITPIARRGEDGRFELDLVLRNNRTSDEHPLGIFHPHGDLHHIKKENIGLIEVMGLAVLPGRLQRELQEIAEILLGNRSLSEAEDHGLEQHLPWIAELQQRYSPQDYSQAMAILQDEVGAKFARVLEDAGVFKLDETGQRAFLAFLAECGFSPVAQ